jgi:glucose/mannose-6-phosphate isomerase
MDLEEYKHFHKIDKSNMYKEIQVLPDQLEDAWELQSKQDLTNYAGVKRILVAGMGGSAIGGDLLEAFIYEQCTLPIIVHRGYTLPAWAKGLETLVICSSHSGNTEETLTIFKEAGERDCQRLAITTGGNLKEMAKDEHVPIWEFHHKGQPRAAVGYSFGLLLGVIHHMGLIPDPSGDLQKAVEAMRVQRQDLAAEIAPSANPAKQFAQVLHNKWIMVLASDYLAPVSRRWKTQASELAKAWAQYEYLPEANHNTLAGFENPHDLFNDFAMVYLRANSDNPRNHFRSEYTQKEFEKTGGQALNYEALGDNPLSHIWTTLSFGDYLFFYLAMLYDVDPTPVEVMQQLKAALKEV